MRIGIVGAGIRGTLFHRALAGVAGVTVAGMCDPSPAARAKAAESFEGRVLDDHTRLYELGLDAVLIASPDFAHRDAAVDAARAGLHMMIEKPLATTVRDATAIRDAVAAADVRCLVAFENRWNPHFIRVRASLDRGDIGAVVAMTGVLSNTFYVPMQMLSWAAMSSPGWFLMPHTVDLSLWLSGQTPSSVVAHGHRGLLANRGIDTWDVLHALLRFDNGAVSNLQSSWVLPDHTPAIADFRYEVFGSAGSVSVDMTDQGLRTAGITHPYRSSWALPVEVDGQEQSMAAWAVRSFVHRLATDQPLGPDAEHGLLVTRIVDAVHRAAATGEVVTP
jgi:predicted dehydrogenase